MSTTASPIVEITRRDFLARAGLGTGALVLGFTVSPKLLANELTAIFTRGIPAEGIPFVALKLNGNVTIITHRAEMGQGIRSSLAAVLADEMEADWSRVALEQSDADSESFGIEYPYHVPDKPRQYIVDPDVAQFTDSSRSMAAYYMPMRLFGGALRLVLERAAAAKWGVKPEECHAMSHRVYRGDPRTQDPRSLESIDYRWLLLGARKQAKNPPTYDEIRDALKPHQQWVYINDNQKKMPFVDARDMVTGKTEYCADIQLRGMLTAMVEHSPVANGDVKSFDATETMKVPGVVDVMVVRIPGPLPTGSGGVGAGFLPHAGVAVLATSTWAAWQGRRKLKVEWDNSAPAAAYNATYDSASYRRDLEASTSEQGRVVRQRGDVEAAFSRAAATVEANYYVPLLVPAPMEPPVAVAVMKGDHLEVWAPTQNPDSAQQIAGWAAFDIPFERRELETVKKDLRKRVTVHMPLLGGGFGRKSKPDFVAEAAYLAAKRPGTPIRVQWTREDDIRFGFYNAVSNQYLKAAFDANGKATALLQRSAYPSIFATLFPPDRDDFKPMKDLHLWVKKRETFHDGGEYPYGSGVERAQGYEDMPFNLANIRLENCKAHNKIRIGWMRSVANVYHAFGIGSFADEMARKVDRDPKDYLLELIGERQVLDEKTFAKEGVRHFNNNEFPVEQVPTPVEGAKSLPVVRGYPPDTARLRAVVQRVAEGARWDARKGTLGPRRGLGIAAHRSFLTYVALVFDVSLSEKNELTINAAHIAVDCGLVVNPDRVKAQIEGGINYGLSMALLGEITVAKGAVEQRNFDDYPALRINQTPKELHIYFLNDKGEHDVAPTGIGEPPTPVVAPALANAIVAAGGPRIREIPFFRHVKVL